MNRAKQRLPERFDVLREIGRGGMGVVYEARDRETGILVALKTLSELDPQRVYLLKQEFRALAELEHPNLVRLGELHGDGDEWFFTMELLDACDFLTHVWNERPGEVRARAAARTAETRKAVDARDGDGRTPAFADVWPGTPAHDVFDEGRLRRALVQLVRGVSALHRAGKLHRDLKPSNVLVEDGRVVIVDFGLVRPIEPEAESGQGWDQEAAFGLAGTLVYMAPEQMSGDDFGAAADWFAVGVILFEALTRTRPFWGTMAEILFDKAGTEAPDPGSLVQDLPEDLRAVCRALLNPFAALRPNGAEILERLGVADVEEPVSEVRRGRASAFVGRADELLRLDRAYAACLEGEPSAVLVVGEPGVGKSTMVEEFLADLPGAVRPTVFRGRCYQKESVPFKAFDRIVDQLTRYLAYHDQTERLSAEVRLASGLFPVLRRVSWMKGAAAPRADRYDNVEQLRQAGFRGLTRIFAEIAAAAPLVMFVDDLQWADAESLALLEVLLTSPAAPPCLFVATSRPPADGHRELSPPLVACFERLELTGLSPEDAAAVLSRLLPDASTRHPALARLVQDSRGHPLFLHELARLAETREPGWAELRVEDAIERRVANLEPSERGLLEAVAVAGAPVSFEVLTRASGQPPADCVSALRVLSAQDLVSDYRRDAVRVVSPFHDRIREAVVAELVEASPGRAMELELALGRSFAEAGGDGGAEPHRAADHLNAARELIDDAAELERLRELNAQVGRASLEATSYEAARRYLRAAEALEAPDSWSTRYRERLALSRDLLTCAYQLVDLEELVSLKRALLDNARDRVDRAQVHGLLAALEASARRCEAALEAGRAGLAELGVTLPRQVTPAHAMAEHLKIRWLKGRRSVEALSEIEPLVDAEREAIVELISTMTAPAFFVDSILLAFLLMRIAAISLRHGLSPASGFAFAGYGLVLSGIFERHDEARRWGELARVVNAAVDGHRYDAKVGLINATFINSWIVPLPAARAELEAAWRDGLEHGDPEYVSYAIVSAALFHVMEGGPIATAEARTRELLGIAETIGDRDASFVIEVLLRHYVWLVDGEQGSRINALPRGALSGQAYARELSDAETPAAIFWFHVFNAWDALLHGDAEAAALSLREAAPRKARTFAFAMAADYMLLELLVDAAQPSRGLADRARRVALCRWRLRKFQGWARWQPGNFSAHRHIGEAACLRLEGRRRAAARAALRAVEQARRTGALRSELLAHVAIGARAEAAEAASRWGAGALAERLKA